MDGRSDGDKASAFRPGEGVLDGDTLEWPADEVEGRLGRACLWADFLEANAAAVAAAASTKVPV